MFTLQDKAVVITGGASGIGAALARDCAARGARLLLADIDEAGVQKVASDIRQAHPGVVCHTTRTDSGSEAEIEALAQKASELLGGTDVLINNAGVALVATVEKLRTEDAHWLMNINFWGVVHGCRSFLPQMRLRPQAVLVNISSIFAMVSMPTQSIYNASKAAVRGFADALREELRGTSVRVLTVHPGGIKTNIANKARVTDLTMMANSEQEFRDHFMQVARTTPQQAARVILNAVESGSTRVLIGADARMLDWMYRLFPTRASGWLTRMSDSYRQRAARKK